MKDKAKCRVIIHPAFALPENLHLKILFYLKTSILLMNHENIGGKRMRIEKFLRDLEKDPQDTVLRMNHCSGPAITSVESDGCNIWLIPSTDGMELPIKEIIHKIKQFDCPANGLVKSYEMDGEEILFINSLAKYPNRVWVEDEMAIDMIAEIEARLQYPIEQLSEGVDIDETDFYRDMLEDGMDVERVERYAGKESAKHMCDYCKEHGLLPKYGIKITYSWGDEEPVMGEYKTKKKAYKKICKLIAKEAYVQNEEFERNKQCVAYFNAHKYSGKIKYLDDNTWCYYNVIEL